jgi:hypothetical protein
VPGAGADQGRWWGVVSLLNFARLHCLGENMITDRIKGQRAKNPQQTVFSVDQVDVFTASVSRARRCADRRLSVSFHTIAPSEYSIYYGCL